MLRNHLLMLCCAARSRRGSASNPDNIDHEGTGRHNNKSYVCVSWLSVRFLCGGSHLIHGCHWMLLWGEIFYDGCKHFVAFCCAARIRHGSVSNPGRCELVWTMVLAAVCLVRMRAWTCRRKNLRYRLMPAKGWMILFLLAIAKEIRLKMMKRMLWLWRVGKILD